MFKESRRGQISKAGLLLSAAAGVWLLLAPILGHMGPPWPCFVVGSGVLASLGMIWRRPEQQRGWALLVIVLSTTLLLIGSSAILPAGLGVVGGAFIIASSGGSEPDG